VNKESGGGNKSGSGRGHPDTHESAKNGGRLGGKASVERPAVNVRPPPKRPRRRGRATPITESGSDPARSAATLLRSSARLLRAGA